MRLVARKGWLFILLLGVAVFLLCSRIVLRLFQDSLLWQIRVYAEAGTSTCGIVSCPKRNISLEPPVNVDPVRSPDELLEMLKSTNFSTGIESKTLVSKIYHHHEPKIPDDLVEDVKDADVTYFIKACKKFGARAVEMYRSWGKTVSNVVFSTDEIIDGIPAELQIVTGMASSEAKGYLTHTGGEPAHHAASCIVTISNFGKFLALTKYRLIKWLVLLDDDTFVIPKNLMEYLSAFPSTGNWYIGLSNAEMPYLIVNPGYRRLAVTASAPGVAYSRTLMNKMRSPTEGLRLTDLKASFQVCFNGTFKDDVALGYVPLVKYNATFVARPDLRNFHFRELPDPVDVKPLTVHTQLQRYPTVLKHIFVELTEKYRKYV